MVGSYASAPRPIFFALSANAQAQYPWGYAPYPPSYAPYGGPYAPPVQGRSPASFTHAMLDAHNVIRARVGVPPLFWSTRLAEMARDWANHLITTGAFGHRPDNRYGENIYAISNGNASPAQVVGYWADEARGYGYTTQYMFGCLRPLHAARLAERRKL